MTVHPGLSALVSLHGKVLVVTGAAGGIGAAASRLLLAAGAEVVSVDLPGAPVVEGSVAFSCDLRDPDAIDRVTAEIDSRFDRLDGLVHCAGVTQDAVLWKMSREAWSEVLAVNLDSAFHLLHRLVPSMRKAGGGAVVLVSSINGERGKFGQANYAASKAGLIALGKTAARELGAFGIRVNTVSPGLIRTAMTERLPDEHRQRAIDEAVLGRAGEPEDVAGAVLFLCSDMARHVTGQTLRVDGGQWMA